MFSIGEFSKITGLTVKTLRFYHEERLLEPSHVDEETGYRYYSEAKVETARVIGFLRDLGFPLEAIKAILRDTREDADLFQVMEQRKAAVEQEIRRLKAIETSLDQFLSLERETRRVMREASFEVQESVLEPTLIASLRMRGRYADCGKAFSQIGKRYGRHIHGKPFLLHHDAEFRENDADFEVCFPVRRGQNGDGFTVRELPGGRCVTLLHKGPYDQLGRSYEKMLKYLHEKHYTAQLPTREVYLKGPGMIFRGNPKTYLTEIQIVVAEASSHGTRPL